MNAINPEFYDVITECEGIYSVCGLVTKEDIKTIYDAVGEVPKNQDLNEDHNYTCGELMFNFDPKTGENTEILCFPSYPDEDGCDSNGDFIYVSEEFADKVDEAKKYLNNWLNGVKDQSN